MSNCVTPWNLESDGFMANTKRPMGADQELVELLWQNGQVVLHSQGNRKTNEQSNDAWKDSKHDQLEQRSIGTYVSPSNLIQADETLSWIHCPLDDSFEKDFASNFFPELQTCDVEASKQIKHLEEKTIKFGDPNVQEFSGDAMPPPGFRFSNPFEQNQDSCGLEKVVRFSGFSTRFKGASGSCKGKGKAFVPQNEGQESSVMTLGSSHCGSNQFSQDVNISRASTNAMRTHSVPDDPLKDDMQIVHGDSDHKMSETLEPTFTFSSGVSGSTYGKTHGKRKVREAEESEDLSEATELKSAAGNRSSQRASSSRKARAAEVHNLSERRRRDRINEKMRALQELLPHSSKTDKASMLDEAIEYLKLLQLQLQVMWMGTGMRPIMYPGVQHYMPRVGVGMATTSLPHFHNPMHLPRMQLVDQSIPVAQTPAQAMMCQTPVLPSVHYQSQMQNPNFSQQYARYMGFHLMQNPSQAMNMLNFGPQVVQPGQTMMPPSNSSLPHSERANADHPVIGKMG